MPENQENIPVCPSCLAENKTSENFCGNCGRPLGNFANYDPVNRILSEGWAYRRALSQPDSTIVFVGIWLLFLPALVTSLAFARMGPAGIAVSIPMMILYVLILVKGTRNYFRRRSAKRLAGWDDSPAA